jgi:hypothetical protein
MGDDVGATIGVSVTEAIGVDEEAVAEGTFGGITVGVSNAICSEPENCA